MIEESRPTCTRCKCQLCLLDITPEGKVYRCPVCQERTRFDGDCAHILPAPAVMRSPTHA